MSRATYFALSQARMASAAASPVPPPHPPAQPVWTQAQIPSASFQCPVWVAGSTLNPRAALERAKERRLALPVRIASVETIA